MEREIHVGEFHGSFDGERLIGFDYASQCWIDSRPTYPINRSKSRGSASNPITEVPLAICEAIAPFEPVTVSGNLLAPIGWDHV